MQQQYPQPIEFLRDGRLALPSPCTLVYVDVAKRKTLRPVVPSDICNAGSIGERNFALSADGQTVFFGSDSGTADLVAYDTATGRRRFSPAVSTSLPLTCATEHAQCLFTQRTTEPNLANVHEPVTLAVLDSNTGRLVSNLTIHAWSAGSEFIDSDRELLVREWTETNVDLYAMDVIDPHKGLLKRQFPSLDGNVSFASSASRFAMSAGSVTKIFDTYGRLVNTVSDTSDNVRFFPDGSKLLVNLPDGTLAIRSAITGKLLVTLAFFPHAGGLEWLAYTPGDYYAGSPFGIKLLRWRVGARTFARANFANRFLRPNRVAAALR